MPDKKEQLNFEIKHNLDNAASYLDLANNIINVTRSKVEELERLEHEPS